jgi:O-acetyl-ADP-ribose deacetylase
MSDEWLVKQVKKNKFLRLVQGDITEEEVDAIVNPANSYLRHTGGVAGAIVRKGGYVIQEESSRFGFLPVGEAVLTTGGALPSSFVIHAVGPRWGTGEEDIKLANAVTNSLRKAEDLRLRSITLPAISTGVFGYPKDKCAKVMTETIVKYIKETKNSSIKEVRIIVLDDETLKIFKRVMKKVLKIKDE